MRWMQQLGLDWIITEEKRLYLIEIQHGFGLSGLKKILPAALDTFNKTRRVLGGKLGTNARVEAELRAIADDKMWSYKASPSKCPSSILYQGYTVEISDWAAELESDTVIAKPLHLSRGRGIRAIPTSVLIEDPRLANLTAPMILQEFVRSRLFPDDEGRPHIASIRHAMVLVMDRTGLGFIHTPSYWRVAARPFPQERIANISRGAKPQPLDDDEQQVVWDASEEVGGDLLEYAMPRWEPAPHSASWYIGQDGQIERTT